MLDDNLMWIRDTGLIQKMETDAARDHVRVNNQKLQKGEGERPMTLLK